MTLRGSTAASEIDALFESFVTGLRGETLRAQLAAKHPERTREDIEDAIQIACEHFITETDGIDAPGQVYRWLRTCAHRALNRERELLTRQVPVDPSGPSLDRLASPTPTPEQEAIRHEDEVDLAALTEAVAAALPHQRQRDVLALYGAGCKRPEIADRLSIRDRVVKRDLLEIMEQARIALARLEGGGCDRGEPLMVRLACGLATPTEATQAQLHLSRCDRCRSFHERLGAWREKVGAILPIPATEHVDPGLLERTLHKTFDTVGSLRQHLADGGAQVKQQATTAYYRTADPTPLAGARPGAVAAVVAGCLAVGTGTYTCVEQGINPLTSLPGLREEAQEKPTPDPPDATPQPAPDPPPVPVAVEPAPAPAPEPTPAPPPAEPVEPAPQPPPEQSFEPSSPAYSPPPAQSSATPAPVASGNGSTEFEP